MHEKVFLNKRINVVNAVLLKLSPELYHSRYNSFATNVNQDTNFSAINAKPMGTILSDLNFTQGLKHSTSSQAINAKPMDTISAHMFQQNQITLNTVIKAESLYQLMYLQIYATC